MLKSALYLAAMNLPLTAAAARAALAVPSGTGASLLLCRTAVAYLSGVVGITAVLGALGLAAPPWLAVASLWLGANVLLLFPFSRAALGTPAGKDGPPSRALLALLALALPILALVLLMALIHPPRAYDAMTYHLFFPARWLQEERLFVVPTPFGDPAPAFSPAGVELWYLWLLAPFHADTLARAGQFPLLLLALAALYGLARELGHPRTAAALCALLFAANPLVLRQAASPEADLAMAAFLFAALFLLLAYRRAPGAAAAAFAGAAAGLFVGTKYVAAAYLPALAALALWVFLRGDPGRRPALARRAGHLAVWALLAFLAGGFWYARNLLLFGSPVFPAGVWILGRAIFEGPITRAAMLRSVFHVPDAHLLPLVAAHATDLRMFFPLLLLFTLGAGITLVRRRDPLCLALLTTTPALVLIWAAAIPYNSQYRFLLPAVGMAWLATGSLWERRGPLRALALAVAAAAVGWVLFLPVPPFERGGFRLSAVGLVPFRSLPVVLACAAALVAVLLILRRRGRLGAGTLLELFPLAVLLSAALLRTLPAEERAFPLRLGFSKAPEPAFAARAQVGRETTGTTIAYAGTNAPYPLLGPRLSNRVVYVNPDGRLGWLLSDYFRARLAQGKRPAPSDKPTFDREGADPERWWKALCRLRVNRLYVEAMGPDERRRLEHDRDGFPIERAWARKRPDRFRSAGRFTGYELYEVRCAKTEPPTDPASR